MGIWPVAMRKLDLLDQSSELIQLSNLPGNRLEALRGNLEGWYSIRINNQWRIIFQRTDDGPDGVQIVDYHA